MTPARRSREAQLYLFALTVKAAAIALIAGPGASLDGRVPVMHGAFWPLLPPLLADALVPLGRGQTLTVLLLYAALASLAAPMAFRIACALGAPSTASLFAGLCASLYPYHVAAAANQPSVGISIVLTSALVFSILSSLTRRSLSKLLCLAVLSAVAILDRGEALFFGPACAVALSLVSARSAGALNLALVLLAMVGGALASGAFRWHAHGSLSPLAANGGYNLVIGHNRYVREYLARYDVPSLERIVYEHPELAKTPSGDAPLRRRAWAYAKQHPGETLGNTLRKAIRHFGLRLENADNYSRLKNLAYAVPYFCLLALGGIGAARLARSRLWFPLVATLGLYFVHSWASLVTLPLIRVRMHSEFLLFILAGFGLAACLELAPRRAESGDSRA